ncbi:peptidase A24 [Candidatus Acidianus copahuensis]|uniref:Peptidase A24 n=2 Tax=Candidatus Acidianus copahuensis TaxID=1160895 RepID=A0A031LLJ1_9CREN|nr:A24 family peptidase C-terminal domain-containing protein [Candidatus Acidianus copahuensis]EZQ02104.1 peptidase A24 [Candidatus Acidianus copahuensis]
MNVIYAFQIILTSVMLFHTSYLDVKKREVDFKVWGIYTPLIIFFLFYYHSINFLVYSYSFGVSILIFYVFYRFSMMGGADLIAVFLVGLSNPVTYPLFFSKLSELGIEPIVFVLFTSLSILVVSVLNMAKYFKYTKGLPFSTRVILSMSAKRIKVKDFLNSSFLFPLTVVNDDGSSEMRTSFSIEEDDKEWREKYLKLVRDGRLTEDDYIWVAWGVPVIPFMLIGYLISLFIGLPFS